MTGSKTSRPRPSLPMRLLRIALVATILFYPAWCATLYFQQDAMVFPRNLANQGRTALAPARGATELTIETPDGPVHAWFVEPPSHNDHTPVAVYFHGNAELIQDCLDTTEFYTSRGFCVLIPEYRGYGTSAGTPSEDAIVADALAFIEQLRARPGLDFSRLILHGRSLGGGVAAQIALRVPPRALVLDCTFTSIASFAGRYAVPAFLVRNPFHTDEVLPSLTCPILISHGTADTVIPYSHSQALSQLNPKARLNTYPCGHLDFPGDREAYNDALTQFLRDAGVLP